MLGPLGWMLLVLFVGIIFVYFAAKLPPVQRWLQLRKLEAMRREITEEGLDPDSPEGQRALRVRMKNAHQHGRGARMTNIDGAGGMGVDN